MSLDDFIVEMKFFTPSESLTETIVDLNEAFVRAEGAGAEISSLKSKPKSSILGFRRGRRHCSAEQRVIAERLYRYLASVSRNSKDSEIFYIWECIPHGMAVMVGFRSYADLQAGNDLDFRAIKSLEQLTTEFRNWLTHRGRYEAPWGSLSMIDSDRLRLSRNDRERRKEELCVARSAFAHKKSEADLTPAFTVGSE